MPAIDHEAQGRTLSERERAAMDLLCIGKAAKQIAAALGINRVTVSCTLARARTKYGARTTTQAAVIHELKKRGLA